MTTTTKLLTADEALAAMDAIEAAGPPVIGGVVVEKLPDGYYWLTWSTEKFDKTRRCTRLVQSPSAYPTAIPES